MKKISFDKEIVSKNISKALDKDLLKYENILVKIYKKIIFKNYEIKLNNVIRAFSIYDELTDFYKPKIITVPGENLYEYLVLSFIYKKKKY